MAGLEATWNVNAVAVSLAAIPLEGGGDDSWLTITYDSDSWEDIVDVNGKVVRVATNDERAGAKITCRVTSPMNRILMGLEAADRKTGLGAVPFACDIPNLGKFASASAWVRKVPDIGANRTPGEMEWEIRCAALKGTPAIGISIGEFFADLFGF